MGLLDLLFGRKRTGSRDSDRATPSGAESTRVGTSSQLLKNGDTVIVQILDAMKRRPLIERWLIGRDVSVDVAVKAMNKQSLELYAIRTYESGEPRTRVCTKPIWDEAKSEFESIEREASNRSASQPFRTDVGDITSMPSKRYNKLRDVADDPIKGLVVIAAPELNAKYSGIFLVRPRDLSDWLPPASPVEERLDDEQKNIIELRKWLEMSESTTGTPQLLPKKYFNMLDGLIDEITRSMDFVVVCKKCDGPCFDFEKYNSPPIPEESRRPVFDVWSEWKCSHGHTVFYEEGKLHISWPR